MPDRSIDGALHGAEQIDRMHGGQPAVAAPERRADRLDDDDVVVGDRSRTVSPRIDRGPESAGSSWIVPVAGRDRDLRCHDARHASSRSVRVCVAAASLAACSSGEEPACRRPTSTSTHVVDHRRPPRPRATTSTHRRDRDHHDRRRPSTTTARVPRPGRLDRSGHDAGAARVGAAHERRGDERRLRRPRGLRLHRPRAAAAPSCTRRRTRRGPFTPGRVGRAGRGRRHRVRRRAVLARLRLRLRDRDARPTPGPKRVPVDGHATTSARSSRPATSRASLTWVIGLDAKRPFRVAGDGHARRSRPSTITFS